MGRVGLEPTYPKITVLQTAAIPILRIYPNTAYTVAAGNLQVEFHVVTVASIYR